ncbi:hypothetical protein JRQ81_011143 [Phrynocephalus forsythii]|uniref:Coiled-coil SMC6 And NSE5 INteracting (CANIN) domain-containing protein n=1 Tax=Phrynocephalus forsythii TaxID=171643 RepID=A0A9Q0X9G7_9SAUR|nr:hypothetical protein JRQ81_011143 [Phrynocephalus forsythii]
MSTMNTGQPEASSPSLSSSHPPGTSGEAAEDLPAQGTSGVAPAPPPTKVTYSMELFRTKKDIRWFQIPLSSSRRPKARLFSFTFQSSLQEYQRLRKVKRLKIGRPFSMLPLPSLPAMLMDSCCKASRKKRDNRRPLGARETQGHKRLRSHREESWAFSRRMRTRLQKCRSSARSSATRSVVHSKTLSRQPGEEPVSSPSETQGQADPGHLQRKLILDVPGPLSSLSCSSYAIAEAGRSDNGFRMWGNAASPLKEEDYEFPPDWSPPRIDFLYNRDPPVLSPAPGPDPQHPGEVTEISTWTAEPPVLELTAKASPPPGRPLQLHGEPSIKPPQAGDDAGMSRPEHPLPVFCPEVHQEEEDATPEDQIEMDEGKAFGMRGHPPSPPALYPLAVSSPVSFSSGISATWEELSGDPESVTCESGEDGDPGPDSPPSPVSIHLLTAASLGMSPRCSASTSSDEPPEGPTQDVEMDEDSDDSGLWPLEQLLRRSRTDRSSAEPQAMVFQVAFVLEERRHLPEDRLLERNPEKTLSLCSPLSSVEVPGEGGVPFAESHRLILQQFSTVQGTIPAVHPGEHIFCPPGYARTPMALDTSGLKPQSPLEDLFFRSQFTRQVEILQDGLLSSLYGGPCAVAPRPVLCWLFQLMSLSPEISADAFRALWEISVHQIASADKINSEFWCPNLTDVLQAFYHLGAHTSTLFPAGLVQPEFRSEELEFLEPFLGSPGIDRERHPENTPCWVTLGAMLGRIFKFLTLCLASRPHDYPDQQRWTLLALLCRISLDRTLRKQPQVELQQLMLTLLQGIRDWPGKLPGFCRSLCHVSQHHHNLVAVVHSFPETTARGRELRRHLSLCFIAKLLGRTEMATMSHWREETQLKHLACLLPLMKPSILKQALQWEGVLREPPRRGRQEAPTDLDLEACYLCHSLLILANVVVGTKAVPLREQGCLQQLCAQLHQHVGANIREDPCLMYRTKLKDLVAQTYIKWQELLSHHRWLQISPWQGQSKNI